MAYKSLVTPNIDFEVLAGNCLAMAQGITGAPIMHPTATDAANATKYRHANHSIPNAVCVLWFDHTGTYGSPGAWITQNWGHVVVYVPGYGYASSSPIAGETSTPYYYGSIAEVERAFSCSFRFWTEDINGTRVCQEEDIMTPAQEKKLDRVLAAIDKIPTRVLDAAVPREGVDKDGKKRTGNASLRKMLATWEHQVGITRRIVEKILAQLGVK